MKQPKIILVIGLAIFALACLVPPWTTGTGRYQHSLGFNLLFMPPSDSARIDASRLELEIAVIVTLTAAGFLLRIKEI